MRRAHSDAVLERAREVLGYFLRNPQAADTLEGLVRWRLLNEAIHRGVNETNEALAWLVAGGFLMEESLLGSDSVFRLNPESVDAANGFLASLLRPPSNRDDPDD